MKYKIITILITALLLPMTTANASAHKSSNHSYANKGWKHHKLTGTKQTRYLHATSKKHK